MSSEQKESENSFKTVLTKERIWEKIAFSVMRSMTYFVLFCAGFLFWDIISKGSKKVFEGDGLINWEFITEHPQTLHVIETNGTKQKLSSNKYYQLKEEKISQQWNAQIGDKEFLQKLNELETRFDALSNAASPESIDKLQKSLLGSERNESIQKFDFWISLLDDPKLTAEDFEIKESEVAPMVSTFMNGFFSSQSTRLKLLEKQLLQFKASHFRGISSPDAKIISEIKLAYVNFLEVNLPLLVKNFLSKSNDLNLQAENFLSKPEPKPLGDLVLSFSDYKETKQIISPEQEHDNEQAIEQLLSELQVVATVEIPSKDFSYSGGGIFPAIVGTFLLVIGAMLIAIILGVFCAIFLAEYGKSGRFLSTIRLAILNLAGVPSIIFGLFGFGLFVIFLDWNVSLIAGWFTLAIMVLPVVITASEESLRSIPQGFRESSLALGASKWTMIRTSVLPYAMPGILTSSILGVARVAGETAPIMFTAAYAKRTELPWENLEHWSDFFFQGVMALPYHIYVVSAKIPQNEYTADMQYGTAFVFLALVIIVASSSIILRNKLRKKYRW